MSTLLVEHIIRDEKGRPFIAGTRLRVSDVAQWHDGGWSVAEMTEEFDLTAGQIYAALSYYYDHPDEIRAEIEKAGALVEEYAASGRVVFADEFKARIEAQRGQKRDRS